jgi:hypothetical protein
MPNFDYGTVQQAQQVFPACAPAFEPHIEHRSNGMTNAAKNKFQNK